MGEADEETEWQYCSKQWTRTFEPSRSAVLEGVQNGTCSQSRGVRTAEGSFLSASAVASKAVTGLIQVGRVLLNRLGAGLCLSGSDPSPVSHSQSSCRVIVSGSLIKD